MPWSQTSPMDQKIQFISDYLRGGLAFAELCDHFGISGPIRDFVCEAYHER